MGRPKKARSLKKGATGQKGPQGKPPNESADTSLFDGKAAVITSKNVRLPLKSQPLSIKADTLGLSVTEFEYQGPFGQITVVRLAHHLRRKVIVVLNDHYNSGVMLLDKALTAAARNEGKVVPTFAPLRARPSFINDGRPYGEPKEDQYGLYLSTTLKRDDPDWEARELPSLISFKGEEEKNKSYVYTNLGPEQVGFVVEHSDKNGIRARFIYDEGAEDIRDQAVMNNPRLYIRASQGDRPEGYDYGVFVPRTDLMPMTSGPEDTMSVREATEIIRSWLVKGDSPGHSVLLPPRNNRPKILNVSEWEVAEPPSKTLAKMKRILAGPWSEHNARQLGINQDSTLSVRGDWACKALLLLATKVRWAEQGASDEIILRRIHYALVHQPQGTEGDHVFKEPWDAALYYMAIRARSMQIGYYRELDLHPMWSALFASEVQANPKSQQDRAAQASANAMINARRVMAQSYPQRVYGRSPAGGPGGWTRDESY